MVLISRTSSMVCAYFSFREGSVTAYTDRSTGFRARGTSEATGVSCPVVLEKGCMELSNRGAMCSKGPWPPVPVSTFCGYSVT